MLGREMVEGLSDFRAVAPDRVNLRDKPRSVYAFAAGHSAVDSELRVGREVLSLIHFLRDQRKASDDFA